MRNPPVVLQPRQRFLFGSGPAPVGYFACHSRTCSANRNDWHTGRFPRVPNHYHPIGRD